MSDLIVRKPPFEFDKNTPFQWHETNPALAKFMNGLSFLAVGFERYILKVLRDVLPTVDDPAMKEEIELFMQQEAQHSVAHKAHIDSMVEQFPRLKGTLDRVRQHYDNLYKKNDSKYHLAYIATLEATFTPMLTFVINNREPLFSKAHTQIASLFLWHSVEELEHRSSAYVIYNHVVGKPFYRLAIIPSLAGHIAGLFKIIDEEFAKHVPKEVLTCGYEKLPHPLKDISQKERILLNFRFLRCLMPGHNPESETPPDWYHEWMKAYDGGVDITQFYGKPKNIIYETPLSSN